MGKENNKSVLTFDDFDGLNESKTSEQMQAEALGLGIGNKENGERQTKGAAAGCKPGTTRKTFVLPFELIDKLSAIAAHTRQKEVAIVIDMLERGVASYEEKFGKEITSLPKFDMNN